MEGLFNNIIEDIIRIHNFYSIQTYGQKRAILEKILRKYIFWIFTKDLLISVALTYMYTNYVHKYK